MPSQPRAAPAGVIRVIYQELREGDFRKFEAQSNDSDTGGGARDLRFRPYDKFEKIFRKLFPQRRSTNRRRGGRQTQVEILVGRLHWTDDAGNDTSKEATFEPPTDARAGEGRLTKVHVYPPFNRLPPSNEGRVVLLLIQRADGTVWPAFATEKSLRAGLWDARLTKAVLRSLDADRPANRKACGYLDFELDTEYSDA